MFKSDMFPKRGLGSTDVSLILFLLLAPILLVYLIVTAIIGLVGIFSTSEGEKDKNEDKVKQDKPNKYTRFVTGISENSKVTKLDYSNIIISNVELTKRIKKLYTNIETYKGKARSYGFITRLKKKYIKNIQTALREIYTLENFNKIPVSVNKPIAEMEGYIYLNVNCRINAGKPINLDMFERKKNKKQTPYLINKVPTLSLQFEPIELYFFDDDVAIVTKEDYIVFDGDNILAEYRTISLDVSLANKNRKLFNIVDSRCRHFCKDGSIDLRYVNYRLVEMGVLELNISTQKINLLFSNAKYGYSIYKSLLGN